MKPAYNSSLKELVKFLQQNPKVEGHERWQYNFEIARHLGKKPEWNQLRNDPMPILVPHPDKPNHMIDCEDYMEWPVTAANLIERYYKDF